MATNAPSDGQMLYATSETTAKWDTAPTGTGGSVTNSDVLFNYRLNQEDHFVYGQITSGSYLGNFFTLANSGTFAANAPLDTTHSGLALLTTSTSASGAPTLYTGTGTALVGSREIDAEFVWQIGDLSDNTENFHVRVGLHDSTGSTEPVDGVFIRYSNNTNSGNIQFVTRANNSESSTNTSTAISADTWVTNRIVVNADATLSTLYHNGTVIATLTNNIPSVTVNVGRATSIGTFQIIKAAGTTARTLYVDYWKCKH
jgi:hypothetical protein